MSKKAFESPTLHQIEDYYKTLAGLLDWNAQWGTPGYGAVYNGFHICRYISDHQVGHYFPGDQDHKISEDRIPIYKILMRIDGYEIDPSVR